MGNWDKKKTTGALHFVMFSNPVPVLPTVVE